METSIPPVIIPMWLTGFDKLMPEGRAFPYKYFPRPGAQLSVTFGDPIPADEIQKALGVLRTGEGMSQLSSLTNGHYTPTGWMGDKIAQELDHGPAESDNAQKLLKIRAEVTTIIQDRVEALGRSVCGDSLAPNNTD